MGVQVIPIPTEVVSRSLPFPFPILFYSHSHGIPGPIGNLNPMHISSRQRRVDSEVPVTVAIRQTGEVTSLLIYVYWGRVGGTGDPVFVMNIELVSVQVIISTKGEQGSQ